MPDSNPKDPNEEQSNDSVDLSDLKSFSFGTQWTEASKSSDSPRSRGGKGPSRGGDRSARRSGGAPRKDRRPPRPPRADAGGPPTAGAPAGGSGRSETQGRRPPRRGPRGEGPKLPPRPYESLVFDVCFYPEDNCFSTIIKAMRSNHLTYELFHVAKLFMEKPDRFIASITRRAEKGEKPEKVFICAVDSLPFATEEEVFAHAIAQHSGEFFTVEEVEVDPPSGSFPFVNRCPFTKELLGPPNYHKYETALRNHHRTRLPNMSFEKLQNSMETVRDEEVVNQWLDAQKKAIRYTPKVAEGEEAQSFESIEGATGYLRTTLRQKVVKQVNYARVHGTTLENHPDTEAFKAMDGERQRQMRFPLDTANAIRGRMRREKFSIYKKGSKGVTYVCATKRNFRTPGQVMSPDLDRIIRFLEANQSIKAKDMPSLYEAWLKSEGVDDAFDEKKMQRDLHWLIADGYVSHFEDDTLFAQPVLETGSKSDDEAHSHKPAQQSPAPKPEKPLEPAAEATPAGEPEASEPAAAEETPVATPAEPASEEAAEVSDSESVEAAPASEAEADPESPAEASETEKAPEAVAETPVAPEPVSEVPPVAEPDEETPEATSEATPESDEEDSPKS